MKHVLGFVKGSDFFVDYPSSMNNFVSMPFHVLMSRDFLYFKYCGSLGLLHMFIPQYEVKFNITVTNPRLIPG